MFRQPAVTSDLSALNAGEVKRVVDLVSAGIWGIVFKEGPDRETTGSSSELRQLRDAAPGTPGTPAKSHMTGTTAGRC